MLQFAANLTMLYSELDFLDRFAAAKSAGFAGVEFLFPYAYPEAEVAHRLHAAGLTQVLFNLPAGDWAAGERGITALPDRVDEFRAGIPKAIAYARALGCTQINALAGKAPLGTEHALLHATFVDNLRYAAAALGEAGIRLVIEAINTRDIPGFFLSTSAQAFAIIDEVGSPNLRFQYDIYHMQRMEGELAATIEQNIARIGHLQLADNPGRHEPGTGEINYPFLFTVLERAGYDGWIGCEYVPQAGTDAGLGWLSDYRQLAHATVGATG
jgi:hydroxypyruvate isomerase